MHADGPAVIVEFAAFSLRRQRKSCFKCVSTECGYNDEVFLKEPA
jgi:hypothetical protein